MKVRRSANRLYKIIMESSKGSCMLSKLKDPEWLWHLRLGHVNFQAIKLRSKNNMAYGIPKLLNPKEMCTGCLMSKQARGLFPSKENFS